MALINTVIVPTILAADKNQFNAFVAAYQGFAKRVQVDIVDGQLAPYGHAPRKPGSGPSRVAGGFSYDGRSSIRAHAKHLGFKAAPLYLPC